MSKFMERLLGINFYEDELDGLDDDDYFKSLRIQNERLKEKIFNSEEDLTYDEFIRLIDIVRSKFVNSFGCFGTDYEVVIRKKVNKPQKQKKESEKVNDEK